MKNDKVLKVTLEVTALIIIGKLIGFVREAIIASYYGATDITDAFFFAQSMPGTLFPAVCNSFSIAFVSLYVSRISTVGEEEADRYASHMLNLLLGIGVVLGILGVLISPIIVPLLAPGFKGEVKELAIYLTRLVMGSFVLIMAQYILRAILNARKFFIGPQIADLINNLFIICITVVLGRGQSIEILTLTVIVGSFIQVIIQAIGSKKRFHYSLYHAEYNKDFGELFQLALPILFGNSIIQINNIVDKVLSSTLETGSLSALSYANAVNSVVTSIFISALSTILYPIMAEEAVKGNLKRLGDILSENLKSLSFILVPISCIAVVSRQNIVSIVYGRGSFDEDAIRITASVLACYAPCYAFSGIREILNRGFFSIQDTKTPMFNGIIGVGFNVVSSIVFVQFFGVAGIALGATLANVIISALLLYSTHKKIPTVPIKSFVISLSKQVCAGSMMILVLSGINRILPISSSLIQFGFHTFLGFNVYLLFLFFMGNKEITQIIVLGKKINIAIKRRYL